MLDAWIIEEIRRREERSRPRPQKQIERPPESEPPHEPGEKEPNRRERPERGVTIVDFTV